MSAFVKDQRSVVTMPLNCHVMPCPIIHSGPVEVHYACATAEVKTQLQTAINDLKGKQSLI